MFTCLFTCKAERVWNPAKLKFCIALYKKQLAPQTRNFPTSIETTSRKAFLLSVAASAKSLSFGRTNGHQQMPLHMLLLVVSLANHPAWLPLYGTALGVPKFCLVTFFCMRGDSLRKKMTWSAWCKCTCFWQNCGKLTLISRQGVVSCQRYVVQTSVFAPRKNVSAIKSAATLSWSNMTLSEHHCTERNMGRTFEAETCVLAAASWKSLSRVCHLHTISRQRTSRSLPCKTS